MYKEIWLIMLSSGIILLLISLILFFVWGIPGLIDELSGRKAKRRIKMMSELNYNTGTIERLSTNEIYSGIPTGGRTTEEIANIDVQVQNSGDLDTSKDTEGSIKGDDYSIEDNSHSFVNDEYEEEETATSYLNNEDNTGYLDIDDGTPTSFLSNTGELAVSIEILEEQSSL